jgi:phenylacetate-CoA ligase
MHFAEMQTSFFLKRGDRGDALTHWQPHLGRLLLNSSRTGPARAAAMAEAIRRHGCRFLKGLASTLFAFALACRQTGEASLRFIALFTSGETLNPRHRAFLEEVFQSPVLDSYGHMERTVAISQCPRGGYHLNLDYGVLELVDLQPANNGRSRIGRAIGTSLHNMAMPFIRYDIGDEIEIFTQPEVCPCGRTLPLIKSIRGRRGSTLVAPDGTYLTSLHILPELMTGVRFVQFVQESKTDLCLRVVPDGDWPQSQRKQALELVRRAVGPSMTVVLQETTFEQLVREHSGKTPCVVPLDSGHGSVNELFLA